MNTDAAAPPADPRAQRIATIQQTLTSLMADATPDHWPDLEQWATTVVDALGISDSMSFAVRLDEVRDGAQINDHVRAVVFAGPDAAHRAQCGVLVMRRPEGEALQALLGEARR